MPLILQRTIENGAIALWKITEELEDLSQLAGLSTDDLITYSEISPLHRKKEWLATRSLLNLMMGKGTQINYHNDGRPFLENSHLNISISHTTGFVAIMLHEISLPGIDIECLSRQVGRVARRFLSPEELEFCTSEPELSNRKLLIHWCAKEAIFKMVPFSNIEFSTDILVSLNDATHNSGSFHGFFKWKLEEFLIKLEFLEENEVILVWGCTPELTQIGQYKK